MCFVLQKKIFFFFRVRLGGAVCLSRQRPGCSGVCSFCWNFAKLCGAPGFWENVFSFSVFYIEIAYSNFTFCGTYTLSFLGVPRNFSETITPTYRITACGMSFNLHSQSRFFIRGFSTIGRGQNCSYSDWDCLIRLRLAYYPDVDLGDIKMALSLSLKNH